MTNNFIHYQNNRGNWTGVFAFSPSTAPLFWFVCLDVRNLVSMWHEQCSRWYRERVSVLLCCVFKKKKKSILINTLNYYERENEGRMIKYLARHLCKHKQKWLKGAHFQTKDPPPHTAGITDSLEENKGCCEECTSFSGYVEWQMVNRWAAADMPLAISTRG